MKTSRSKHFDSVEEASSEVSDLLRETSNKARNVTYVILCDNDRTSNEFQYDAESIFHRTVPKWAWAAHYAHHCLYVGATTNLHNRFFEHCFDDDRAALFTGLFPPKSLIAVSQFRSSSEVFNAESRMADKVEESYREQYSIGDDEEVFVYQS